MYVLKLQSKTLKLGCKTLKYLSIGLKTFFPLLFEIVFTTRRCFLYQAPVWRHMHELVAKEVTPARKGLGTNTVGLATELSLVSKLL